MSEHVADSDSPSPDRARVRKELTLVRVATLLCAITTAFLLFMLVFAALGPGGFLYWPAYLLPVLHLAVLWLLRSPDGRDKGTRLARLTGGFGAMVGVLLLASTATGRTQDGLAAAAALFAPIVVAHLALAVAAGRLGAAIRGATGGGVPRALVYAAAVGIVLFAAWVVVPTNIHTAASRNDSIALGDVRTVISAQLAYSSANHGYYDELSCLAAPWECIPGYPREAPQFLGEGYATDVKDGYRRALRAGPPTVVEADEAAKISPSSIRRFAYVAIPVEPEKSGYRAFCGDSDGVIRYSRDGTMPRTPDGRCPQSLEELQ